MHLAPDFVRRVQNIRRRGTLAKINYAVSSLRQFSGMALDAGSQGAALPACRVGVRSIRTLHTPRHHMGCEGERLGDLATRVITSYAPGFDATVLARRVITPLDLERTYGLTGGHIFHGELTLDQLFVVASFDSGIGSPVMASKLREARP